MFDEDDGALDFAPLGLAYLTTLMASLLVSLTVTPVLASFLLPKARFLEREGGGLGAAAAEEVCNLSCTRRSPVGRGGDDRGGA